MVHWPNVPIKSRAEIGNSIQVFHMSSRNSLGGGVGGGITAACLHSQVLINKKLESKVPRQIRNILGTIWGHASTPKTNFWNTNKLTRDLLVKITPAVRKVGPT